MTPAILDATMSQSDSQLDEGECLVNDPTVLPDSIEAAVLCMSGGMDSTSLALHVLARGCSLSAVSFNYGQKHSHELEKVASQLKYWRSQGIEVEHRVIDLSSLGAAFHSALTDPNWRVPEGHYESDSMKQTVVPNRNAIFASIAFGLALSKAEQLEKPVALGLGVHSGDHAIYPDCRPEFYEVLQQAFTVGNWGSDRVHWYLPYLHGDKVSILRDAMESIDKLGLDFDTVFGHTLTCYEPDQQGRSSGKTGSDVERILAFHSLGIKDPIAYTAPWEQVVEWALQCRPESK